jgi:hypothetical protein
MGFLPVCDQGARGPVLLPANLVTEAFVKSLFLFFLASVILLYSGHVLKVEK